MDGGHSPGVVGALDKTQRRPLFFLKKKKKKKKRERERERDVKCVVQLWTLRPGYRCV